MATSEEAGGGAGSRALALVWGPCLVWRRWIAKGQVHLSRGRAWQMPINGLAPGCTRHCRRARDSWELCVLLSTSTRGAGLGHLSRGLGFRGPYSNGSQATDRKTPPGNGAWGLRLWSVCVSVWACAHRVNLIKSCFRDQAKFSSCLSCWFDSFPATPSHLPVVPSAGD